MGVILGSRVRDDGKVIFEVLLDQDEAIHLKGHMDNIHVFSENAAEIETNISQRGKNEATKYFLIPKTLRHGLTFDESVKCQKIDTKTRTIFVYVVDKIGF